MNILLTAYDDLYTDDFILPSGRLREWPSAATRADIIIVTKCPQNLSQEMAEKTKDKISIAPNQHLFFSLYRYGVLYSLFTGQRVELSKFEEIVLICAIASESYLMDFLVENVSIVHTMIFEDHHYFNSPELQELQLLFSNIQEKRKAIVTTEKDATRLLLHRSKLIEMNLEIYVLPVYVEFLFNENAKLNDLVRNQLLSFKA